MSWRQVSSADSNPRGIYRELNVEVSDIERVFFDELA